MRDPFQQLHDDIMQHESNRAFTEQGIQPLFSVKAEAKIVIIGHAPGIRAQEAELAWGDASGARLMQWLGVSEEVFRDASQFAILPMDFYYPGKGKTGDLPPRKAAADLWHPRFFALLPKVELIVLAGRYPQAYYLKKTQKKNLTETVRAYHEYLPRYFPIVHPSPLNFRWLNRNPWFEAEVVPALQQRVHTILSFSNTE